MVIECLVLLITGATDLDPAWTKMLLRRDERREDVVWQWQPIAKSLAAQLDFAALDRSQQEQAVEQIGDFIKTRLKSAVGDESVSLFYDDSKISVQGNDDLRILNLFAWFGGLDGNGASAASVLLERRRGVWLSFVLDAVEWGKRGIMFGDAAFINNRLVLAGVYVQGGNSAPAGAQVWQRSRHGWHCVQSVFSKGSARQTPQIKLHDGKLAEPISTITRNASDEEPDWFYLKESWVLKRDRLVKLREERVPRPDD